MLFCRAGPCILCVAHFVCVQSSLTSEMRDLSFSHITNFHHRHFPEARHDFMIQHPQAFLDGVTADMAAEASEQAHALDFIKRHPQPQQFAPNSSPDYEAAHQHRRLSQHELRQQRRQAMPKHIYISNDYRSSHDSGMCLVMLDCSASSALFPVFCNCFHACELICICLLLHCSFVLQILSCIFANLCLPAPALCLLLPVYCNCFHACMQS